MNRKKEYDFSYYWEKIYPLFLSLIGTTFYMCYPIINLQILLEHSISVIGTLLGFLITVLTIINTMDNVYFRKLKKETNQYLDLIGYLKSSIKIAIIFLIIALFRLSIDFEFLYQIKFYGGDLINSIVVFLFLFTVLKVYRFIDIFLYIIK